MSKDCMYLSGDLCPFITSNDFMRRNEEIALTSMRGPISSLHLGGSSQAQCRATLGRSEISHSDFTELLLFAGCHTSQAPFLPPFLPYLSPPRRPRLTHGVHTGAPLFPVLRVAGGVRSATRRDSGSLSLPALPSPQLCASELNPEHHQHPCRRTPERSPPPLPPRVHFAS